MAARETKTQRLQRIASTPVHRLLPSEAKEFTDWMQSGPKPEERKLILPPLPIDGAPPFVEPAADA